VYANVTGAPYGAGGSVRDILARQVSSKVYWAKIMNNVIKAADAIIECGPGNVLSKLAKKQAKALGKDIPIFKASTMKDIAEIEKSVRV
jgi:malonyl CoA-acyl carrier protein transacylase